VPHAMTDDGVALYYEITGQGNAPILFIHEFAGDHRSWEPQVARFSRSHACITFAARGYPPSDVPTDPDAYSQGRAVADALSLLDHEEIARAHVVGLSMGGFTALHMAMRHPDRCLSAVVAGVGYGAHPNKQAAFRTECEVIARAYENEGASNVAVRYAVGPSRVQFQNKDPAGWRRFAQQLAEHSSLGSALTMRGVQKARPSIYDLVEALGRINIPVLIVNGDEDDPCLEAGLMMKQTIPTAGLLVVPRTGHTINLEEPDVFNDALARLFELAEADRWGARDPRARATSTTGMDG
jgi:pimeloyl-ACP methyl ester carboxylesterase